MCQVAGRRPHDDELRPSRTPPSVLLLRRTQEIPSGEEHRRTTQANEWNRDQFNRNPLQGPLLVDLGRDTTKGSVVCL